jgi:hypothetical protein
MYQGGGWEKISLHKDIDFLRYNGGMDTLSLFTLLLACATFLLAVAAFWAIWQNYKFSRVERRLQALYRIRIWVEKSIELSTVPSPLEGKEVMEVLRKNVQIIRAGSLGALADAEAIGGEVKQKVQKAVHNFNDFTDKAVSAKQSSELEVLLKNLLGDFWEVLKSTSKL